MDAIHDLQIAAFFDCENFSWQYESCIMGDLASRGRVLIRKAYGDFHSKELAKWKRCCEKGGIDMIQKSALNAAGKNAADMALCIDAMEMLVTRKNIQVFVLATSDSDFSPLALRLQEHGKSVIGFGSQKTARVLRQACDEFVVLPNLKEGKNQNATDCSLKREHSPNAGKDNSATQQPIAEEGIVANELIQGLPSQISPRLESQLSARTISASSHVDLHDLTNEHDLYEKTARKATCIAVKQFVQRGDADEDGWVHTDRLLAYMKRLYRDWQSLLVNWNIKWTNFLQNCENLEVKREMRPKDRGYYHYCVRVKTTSSDGNRKSNKDGSKDGKENKSNPLEPTSELKEKMSEQRKRSSANNQDSERPLKKVKRVE